MKSNLLTLAIAVLILTGCASTQETRFYTLSTLEPATPAQAGTPSIFVAPIHLPSHLDHPSVITQADPNELAFSDVHCWGEPLEGGLRHTLARNLGRQLKSDRIFSDGRKAPDTMDFQVEVWVVYLSGTLGKNARLEVRWGVRSAADNQLIAMETFHRQISLTNESHLAYVHAQSALLTSLSLEIANTIEKNMPSPTP